MLAVVLSSCLLAVVTRAAESVDHFKWGLIPAHQWEGQGFKVNLSARNASDKIVAGFHGSVALSALAPTGPGTNMILGSVAHSDFFDSGSFTLGYAFTPDADLLLTHWRHYAGSKVSLWTDAGVLLASQNVNSTPGVWHETPLASPVLLSAGSRYRIAAYVSGSNYYWRNDGPTSFAHGTIDASYEVVGDGFPTSIDSLQWWLVDLCYAVCAPANVSVMPAASGNFTNGIWSGTVTVAAPVSQLFFRAGDAAGPQGDSNPIQVLAASGRRLEIRFTDNRMVLAWPAALKGFVLEKSDRLTPPAQWRTVTNAPLRLGEQWVLTQEKAAGNWFFRLRQ